MNRLELAAEYPLLAHAAHAKDGILADCEVAINRFEQFAVSIDAHVAALDAASPRERAVHLDAVLHAACEHRIFSLALPHSLGGTGCSMLALSVGLEQLSQRCAAIANLVATHGLALALVGATGNVRWLRILAERIVTEERRGSPYLLSTAATEPSAGSDLEDVRELDRAKLECIAKRSGSGYHLTGSKIYVSNGSIAAAHVVVMPTDRQRPRDTLLAFLVPKNSPGLRVVREENKLGQRASPAAELRFDDCFVGHDQCLSEQSVAGRALDLVLGASRAVVGAFGAGIARGVYETCRRRSARTSSATRGRSRADATLLARMWINAQLARACYVDGCLASAHFGLVSFMEHDAIRRVDRLLPEGVLRNPITERLMSLTSVNDQARRIMNRLPESDIAISGSLGSAAKVSTSELALTNCELAFELLGGESVCEESGIPKYWRDARLLSIYEGTNDICLIDVANKQPELESAR